MEPNYQQDSSLVALGVDEFFDLPLLDAVSPSMRAVIAVIGELCHSSVPVLLIGEYGTGKHSIARIIHANSGGADSGFYVKNCRDLTPDLLDPRLLPGGAGLYLAEIGDLTEDCQRKLMEMLSRQSGNGNARNEIRVICGSSRDLDADVGGGAGR